MPGRLSGRAGLARPVPAQLQVWRSLGVGQLPCRIGLAITWLRSGCVAALTREPSTEIRSAKDLERAGLSYERRISTAVTDAVTPELALSVLNGRRDRQQLEIERLLRLMGGMLADAYADACTVLVQQPRLATASHLVGHLAREIDSGLRELLIAMLPPARQEYLNSLREEGSRDPPRRMVVGEICDHLGIPAGDEVRTAWVSLGWHDRAHRGALREPRVLDDDFHAAWSQFNFVLLEIGRRFEASFLAALPLIEALARVASPTKADLASLKSQVPQSVVAMTRFYSMAGPGWFPLLRKAGFFRNPPGLRPDEDGMVAYVPWPAGPYLVNVAAEPGYAAEVVAVFEALDTDNPQVGEAAADVAVVVSPEFAARLAPKLAAFLAPIAQWVLPFKASEVVVRLAAEGQPEAALVIAKALVPVPDRRAARHRFIPVKEIEPAYANLGTPIVVLLADLLQRANDDPDTGVTLAHSSIWRPAIDRDRHRDNRDEVLSALRDAATAVAREVGVAAVVEVLDSYEPTVFTRLSLHVLAQVPDPQLVAARLTSRALFDGGEVAREYTALLRVGYSLLEPEDRATIAGFVTTGPLWEASADDVARWKLWQLARFGDQVPDDLRPMFDTLVARYGQPIEVDDPLELADWRGTHSPVDAAAIADMLDTELITFLDTWQEPGGWREPTVEGLCNQLQEAVAADPARFARLSPRFIDLAPYYGAAVVLALTRVLAAESPTPPTGSTPDGHDTASTAAEPFAWENLLDFAYQVIERSRPDNTQPLPDEEHRGSWHGCRRHIAELLTEAMRRRRIAYDRAEQVLALILELAQDPEPSPGQHKILNGADPVVEALNTVRGLAFIATMRFLLWMPGDDEAELPSQLLEGIVALLEAHLDPAVDDSSAVRSVYGMYFGVLAKRLGEWTRSHHEKIFCDGIAAGLGAIAWQSFLRCTYASAATFELLGGQYHAAVVALAGSTAGEGADDPADRVGGEATAHLLGHVADLYARGLIDMHDEIMTALFAADVPVAHRAQMLEICGQMLYEATDPPTAVVQRLQALWDWRAQELNAGRAPSQELAAFGWWLGSENLPGSWTLPRLQALLAAGGCPEPSHMVAKRLADLRQNHLPATVRCTALLIDAPTDRWFIDTSRKEISAVLSEGLNADDLQTRRLASETISRLVARGRTSFAQLIS